MNTQEFANLIFGDKPSKREQWFKLLSEPTFIPRYNLPLNDIREDAYKKLKRVTDAHMLSVEDFGKDPVNIFTAHFKFLDLPCAPP